jgi:hypothetical protein
MCVFSPVFTDGDRSHFESKGYIAKDLNDSAALFMLSQTGRRP